MDFSKLEPVHMPIQNGREGMIISKEELLVLYTTHQLRFLHNLNVHHLYKMLIQHNLPSKTFVADRVKKLVKRGFLVSDPINSQAIISTKERYYRMSRRGYETLVKAGLVMEEEVDGLVRMSVTYKNRNRQSHNYGRVTDHTLFVTKFVFLLQLEWYKYHGMHSLEAERGGNNTFVFGQGVDSHSVVPDFILYYDNRIVFLEMDTGSQGTIVIENKLKRYTNLINAINESHPGNNYEFFVLFTVVDKSLKGDRSINSSTRVSLLKHHHYPVKTWPSNMRVFVETAERAVVLAYNLLNGINVSQNERKNNMINVMHTILRINLQKEGRGYQIEEMDSSKYIDTALTGWDKPPRCLRVSYSLQHIIMFVTYIEPGEIIDYHRANIIDRKLNAFYKRKAEYRATIFVNLYLYRTQSQLENDQIRVGSVVDTRMISIESLKRWESAHDFVWHHMLTQKTKGVIRGLFN